MGGGFCDWRCRPSLGIVRFCQGITEVSLRISLVLFAIAAIVPAILVFTLGDESLHVILDRMESARNDLDNLNLPIPGSLNEYIDEGSTGTFAAAGLVLGTGIVVLIYQITVTLVRFHQTCLNDFPNCFLFWDILTTFFLAACYFAGAVIAAVFANDLNDFVDPGLPLAILFPGQSDPFRVSKIRNALAAAAAYGFINAVLCIIQGLWMIVFRFSRWNEKLESLS